MWQCKLSKKKGLQILLDRLEIQSTFFVMKNRIALCFCILASPVWADECPMPIDITLQMADLIEEANKVTSQTDGFSVTHRMWMLWKTAPDKRAQDLLDSGLERRGGMDLVGAMAAFDALVEYCPNYAEGYNQRAFVSFMRHDFDQALIDLDIALELSPNHVAAESGKALSLIGLGRKEEAYIVLKSAIRKNPWLPEKDLLARLIDESI